MSYIRPVGDFGGGTIGLVAVAAFLGWLYIIRPGRVRVVSR